MDANSPQIALKTQQSAQDKPPPHVPDTGPFNETTTALLSFGTFSLIGYWIGHIIGRLGDDWKKNYQRSFSTFGKWFGAASFGILAASVAIRQSHESKAQAEALAKHTAEVDLKNEALVAALAKPSLVDVEKNPEQARPGVEPLAHEITHQGSLSEATPLVKI